MTMFRFTTMTVRAPLRIRLLCTALAAASAVPAFAQDAAPTGGLGEIVVTAQKRAESAQTVPISIQSIGADKLATLGAVKLQGIEVAAPSVSFGDGSEQGRTGIRGVIDYSRNAGYDSRVGIYVDGVYYSRSWMNNLTLLGVQQVDVLRGPQGTLFGKNTDAGAISITTIQPSDKQNGEMLAEVGNFGYWKLAGRYNTPLSDSLAFQIAGTHTQSTGYYYNAKLDEHNEGIRGDSVSGQLRYHPYQGLDLTLAADYTRDRNSTLHYTYVPAAGTNPYSINSYYDDHASRNMGGVSLTGKLDLGAGYELTSISAYRAGKQDLAFNNESGATPFLTAFLNQKTKQFSEELRIASPKHRTYDFVAGLYYFWANNQDDPVSAWGSGMTLLGPTYGLYANTETGGHASVSTNSVAGFAQANWRPIPLIEVFAGARVTYEKKNLNDITTVDPIGVFSIPLNGYKDDVSNTFFTPKGGVNVHVARNMMLFGTVGRGFKSAGWNVEGTSAAAFAAGIRFKPETVTSYELGWKSDFFNHRARLNVTGFYEKFKDFQVFTFVPTVVAGRTTLASSLTNAGVVSSKGVEVEAAVVPVKGLTLAVNYTYNDAKFDSYPGGGGQANGAILSADGVQTPYAPKHKVYASADYSGALTERLQIIGHFGYSRQSSENFDPKVVNPVYGKYYFIKGYGVADARIGLSGTGTRWTASLWSKNLFDSHYIRFANRTGVLTNPVLLYAEPRSYGLTIGYKF